MQPNTIKSFDFPANFLNPEFELKLFFLVDEKTNILYIELAHGGHLGFYEGGMVYPNPVTWLDRALVALIGSLVLNHNDSTLKTSAQAY